MAGPPYVDDLTITDNSVLWRSIFPGWIVRDARQAIGWRVSSAAFDDSQDGSPMSVFLADVVISTGRAAADVTRFDGYGLVSLTAGTARAQRQGVTRAPELNEPAHAYVFGKKTGAVKRRFSEAAAWVHLPR